MTGTSFVHIFLLFLAAIGGSFLHQLRIIQKILQSDLEALRGLHGITVAQRRGNLQPVGVLHALALVEGGDSDQTDEAAGILLGQPGFQQIVDIGTASDEEITSFLTKNSEGLREFLNNVSEIVGTPQGMGNYGGLGDYKDIFSDLFGEDFSDFFDKYEIPSFSDFFDKDEFSDFFSDDLFKDDFSNYDFDNSGNESNNDKEDDQDKDPLSDEDGEDDF